ncbi:acyltransferase family protein [Hymenobacter tibetensis]|uniref:acyltransferase family protein n=1 Tax=Hymenobacter tibetensis TaxID=497967 RepID=UPI00374CA5F3
MLKPQPLGTSGQLDSLLLLRGIAVILVCLCHFGDNLSEGHAFAELFYIFYQYGKYGVHVFFVISGFIIPYSLYKSNYTISSLPTFLAKRILRLHPPYLAALFLTLVIMFLSYKVRGLEFPESFSSIAKSVVYLHIPPDNPVFWTLLVEAQYYLFIGCFYVLLVHYQKLCIYAVMPLLLVISYLFTSEDQSLVRYIVFFLIGNVCFLLYAKNDYFFLNLLSIGYLLVFTALFYETAEFLFTSFTLLFILAFRQPISKLLLFPGQISYSIYLIHFPIGMKLINLTKNKIDPSYSWLLLVVALVVSLVTSYIFYILFEKYSERASKKIRYKPVSRSYQSIQKEPTI